MLPDSLLRCGQEKAVFVPRRGEKRDKKSNKLQGQQTLNAPDICEIYLAYVPICTVVNKGL